ncbi:MAG: radical SAM family heme chaperone HemW [Bacillota bacterium]|uniref:radical SAM family heme chaperone HemW n=1 Tax=Desulforudis sp. DRI-14 TaxID=3459793 RepID=UPI00348C2D19
MKKVAVYVHVPFCKRKCYYCDFTSYPFDRVDADLYLRVLPKEIEVRAGLLGEAEAASIFFGGGTPTTLPGKVVAGIIEQFSRYYSFAPDIEITVEANPGTLDEVKLLELRKAGVNRISLGMQAAQDRLLQLLGRSHKFKDVVEAIEMVRDAGFANLNLDIIYGVPEQTMDDWRETVETAIDMAPEHVSAYGLEIHEGTRLADLVAEGRLKSGDEDLEAAMYRYLQDRLKDAGLHQYEISNFARNGYACRHNLAYWRNEEYVGYGPGACSHLDGRRQTNERDLLQYAARLFQGRLPVVEEECPDRATRMAETAFLGLRLIEGLDRTAFAARFGQDPLEAFADVIPRLVRQGLLEVDDHSIRLTDAAFPIANEVFKAFL